MIQERVYNFEGFLKISRSEVMSSGSNPKDDIVEWLFINIGEKLLGFCYEIQTPEDARYDEPFPVKIAFLDKRTDKLVSVNQHYTVFRGLESIGELLISKKV